MPIYCGKNVLSKIKIMPDPDQGVAYRTLKLSNDVLDIYCCCFPCIPAYNVCFIFFKGRPMRGIN